MDEMVMCGICLNTDVKMYRLRGYPLEDDYTWIVGNLLEANISHYFQYACYECAYHIKKYNSFREKCLRSQSLLNEMLRTKGQLTNNDIKSVDRQKYDLCSNLTYGLKNIYTLGYADIKQDCKITVENNVSKEVNDIKIELKLREEKEDEIVTLETDDHSDDDEPSFTTPTEEKETPKTLRTNKLVTVNVDNCQKIEKLKEDSEKDSVKKPRRKLQTPTRKQNPKQNSQRPKPKTIENGLVEHFEVITFTLQEQLEQLEKRKESPNYINSKYKCNICYRGFLDSDVFNKHTKKHYPANKAKICPVCKLCYEKSSTYSRHRLVHAKHYVCKICSTVCSSASLAKFHLDEHEGKIYKCKQCDYVNRKLSTLFTHIRLKHPSDFICDICGFSFVSELGLKFHKSTHRFDVESERNSVTQTGHCKACDVHTNSSSDWKHHINSLTHKIKINGGLNCRECNETFECRGDFRLHQLKVHSEQSSTASLLRLHEISHSDVRPYSCNTCHKAFKSKGNRDRHLMSHTGERPYTCEYCGKGFIESATVRVHIMTVHFKQPQPYKRKQPRRVPPKQPSHSPRALAE